MGKFISTTRLSETLTLTELTDGFWLYDETRKMNLAVHEHSRDAAFVQALTYYQLRLKQVESSLYRLQTRVNAFVDQFREEEDVE
jgi:hypothetical protein